MADQEGRADRKREPDGYWRQSRRKGEIRASEPEQEGGALPVRELKHDVVRLDWAERDAYGRLLRAIEEHPRTREAYAEWRHARELRLSAQAKLDLLEATRGKRE